MNNNIFNTSMKFDYAKLENLYSKQKDFINEKHTVGSIKWIWIQKEIQKITYEIEKELNK